MTSVRMVRDTHRPGGRLVAGEEYDLPESLADALVNDERAEPSKAKRSRSTGDGARSDVEGTSSKPAAEER